MTLGSELGIDIQPQPDDVTCGPTCLDAIYRYYDDLVPLERLIEEVPQLETGGTLAVMLACHALGRGYRATIYTYNLRIFDPTWFPAHEKELAEKLAQQARIKASPKMKLATESYLKFLEMGGRVKFEELSASLLRRHLRKGTPILTGLSATYLYRCPREDDATNQFDDIRGEPQGHFVVLCGYDRIRRLVRIADPYPHTTVGDPHKYDVGIDRLIGAILLGIMTYDGNLLVVEPSKRNDHRDGKVLRENREDRGSSGTVDGPASENLSSPS